VPRTSRQRYRDYRAELARRQKSSDAAGGSVIDHQPDVDASSHRATSPGATPPLAKSSVRQRSFWQLLSQFWRLLGEHRGKVSVALATLTVSTLLGLIPPASTKLAIDYVLTEPPQPIPSEIARFLPELSRMEMLIAIAAGTALIAIVKTVIHLWGRWYATKAVNLVQADVRRRVFEHTLRLPLHRVQAFKSGGAASLLREDAGGIGDLIFNMLYNPWQAIIQLLGSLLILVVVDWRLMVGGLLLLPAVWVTHRTWIVRVRPLYKDIRGRRQQIDSTTTETFGGIRVVRTFGRNRSEANRYTRATHLLARQQLMVWWATRIIEVIWDVLIPLASTALLLYGGWQILQGELTLGDLMMFLVYLTMLLGPIAAIASSAVSFQNNLAGLDRVLDLLDESAESSGNPEAIAIEPGQVAGAIRFNEVSFHYPGTQQTVLQDISFEVPAGATVALVGRSGAGKTTLCNLVARFFTPDSGTIELDGRRLEDIQLDSYRRLLGMVEQDVFLFDGTIAENIAYARRGASQEAIRQAAVAAAADEFIERLPEGFDSRIGERGVKLSGGQRQRLAIARAILADPRILVLDEATSNLDSESERLIQRSLSRLLAGRTAFVIAHRLSTISHADLILVLERGSIVESGTHSELLARGGIYQNMVYLQTEQVQPQ
jgi:ATP-binding cassette, subfamily B, bacterial